MTPSEPLISNWQSAAGKGWNWKQGNTVEREIRQKEALTANRRQIEFFFGENRNGKSDKRHKIGSTRPTQRGCKSQIACRRE